MQKIGHSWHKVKGEFSNVVLSGAVPESSCGFGEVKVWVLGSYSDRLREPYDSNTLFFKLRYN